MPLRKEKQGGSVSVDDKMIDRLIERGGSPSSGSLNREQPQNVQLRALPSLLSQIDAVRNRERKEIRKSRHAWIMEAILDKLRAEE